MLERDPGRSAPLRILHDAAHRRRLTVPAFRNLRRGNSIAEHSLGDNDRKKIAYAKQILREIWDGAGAQDQLTIDRYAHLVGGCRMGFKPEDSVVDASHKVWGLDNLFVVDGSVMPTQGAANPALPIMALADRCADLLKAKRIGGAAAPGTVPTSRGRA